MKKFMRIARDPVTVPGAAAVVAALSLVLVACGAESDSDGRTTNDGTATEEPTDVLGPPVDPSEGWPMSLELGDKLPAHRDTTDAVNASFAHSIDILQAEGGAGNKAISPASLSYAFAIAADGATCESATELNNFLGTSDGDRTEIYTYLAQRFLMLGQSPDGDWSVNLSAMLLDIEPDTVADSTKAGTTAQSFGAGFQQGTTDSLEGGINRWIAESTRGLHTKLPVPIPGDASLAIITTYAATSAWETPGESGVIDFTMVDGSTEMVPAVDMGSDALGYKNDTGWVLKLPTRGGLESLIYLPDESVDPTTLDESVWEYDTSQKPTSVDLSIPIVSLKQSVDVIEVAEQVELGSLDDEIAGCQLSGFAHDGETLIADIVIQDATVEIGKDGLTSSAVTEIALEPGSAQYPMESIELDVDRPFVLMSRDPETKWVGMYAAIADPTEN